VLGATEPPDTHSAFIGFQATCPVQVVNCKRGGFNGCSLAGCRLPRFVPLHVFASTVTIFQSPNFYDMRPESGDAIMPSASSCDSPPSNTFTPFLPLNYPNPPLLNPFSASTHTTQEERLLDPWQQNSRSAIPPPCDDAEFRKLISIRTLKTALTLVITKNLSSSATSLVSLIGGTQTS